MSFVDVTDYGLVAISKKDSLAVTLQQGINLLFDKFTIIGHPKKIELISVVIVFETAPLIRKC